MDLSTKPHVCDFIISPTNGLIHKTTCVWFYHFTYKVLQIYPFVGGMNHTHVDKSICMWNDKLTHMWISPFVGGMIKSHTWYWCVIWSFHLQMDLSTKPHVCDLIIPPTNGLIHNTTCVWFYHSTYKWTYPQNHSITYMSKTPYIIYPVL
jgi:hypothetical protein